MKVAKKVVRIEVGLSEIIKWMFALAFVLLVFAYAGGLFTWVISFLLVLAIFKLGLIVANREGETQ